MLTVPEISRVKFVDSFSLGTSVFPSLLFQHFQILVRSGIQEEDPQYGCVTSNLLIIPVGGAYFFITRLSRAS